MRLAVYLADGAAGAYLYAGVLKAALTAVGHGDDVIRTAIAGELYYIDERRIIVLFGDDGLLDAVGYVVVLAELTHGQTHGKTKPLADDGALN